eukprot:gene16045-16214_t
MIDYKALLKEKLQPLKAEHRYRVFTNLERLAGEAPYALWHKDGISKKAAHKYGVGSGGTRNISGTNFNHVTLEKTVADLHQKDAGLVFVSGYAANEASLCALAKQYNAFTYLDEVHAVGIYGNKGQGLAGLLGLNHQIDMIQGNFAKAYGVVGGYITGQEDVVDYIRSYASGFIFTTSLPPAVAAAAKKSIEILKEDSSYREKLWENNLLEKYGIYVQPINYPTVPKGQERLRLTVTPAHTPSMIEELVLALEACAQLFAKEGAVVILTDIEDSLGQNVATEIGDSVFYKHLDVINNAGITGINQGLGPQDPENCSLEAWKTIHQINLDSVFLGCKYAIGLMKQKHTGSIVNISSRSGIVGVPQMAPYAV